MRIGPYAIDSELGRGGTGIVYRGRAPDGSPVALKLLTKRRENDVARFAREARVQSSLGEKDGFVPLLDVGEAPEGPYLVLPLLTGGSLRDKLKRGPFAMENAVELAIELAAAVERAHERGLVHRDLKPENVLFTRHGRALVADLGLAKHFTFDRTAASQSVALSKTGELRGTVGYMPPEQMTDSKTVGPEADVFALGAIVHELVTGSPAFEAESAVDLVRVVATGESTKLRRARKDAPAWLEAVVHRCLAPNPEDRFRDAGELREALEAGEPERTSRGPHALGIGLGLVALGVGLFGFFKGRYEPHANPSPAPATSQGPATTLTPTNVAPSRQPTTPEPKKEAQALVASGKRHLESEQFEPASADFSRALELDDGLAEAWGDRGYVRLRQQRWEDAIRDSSRAIELEPLDARWWTNRGLARLEQGDMTRAQVDLDRAIELDPKGAVTILLKRSQGLAAKGDLEHGIEDLTRALQLDPKNAKAYAARGQMRRSREQADLAIQDEDRAIELDPGFVPAWGNRGQAWADKHEFEKALADLTRAITLDPSQAVSWGARGIANFNKGDLDAALADTTKAIELDPTIDVAYLIRGLAREKKGDRAGARADLLKAKELGSHEPMIDQALARLR